VSTHLTLPTGEDAGLRRRWELPIGRDATGDSHVVEDATFLGFGTTRTSRHTNHDGVPYALPTTGGSARVRCSACRWYETRLFRVHGDGVTQRYLVHHTGASSVPGEVYFYRYEEAYSAHQVVELFTIRPHPDDVDSHGRQRTPFITRPGAIVLSMAAGYDDAIDDAYVNRAVS
jgi:hypothetical protein